jgi:hypothetical protein
MSLEAALKAAQADFDKTQGVVATETKTVVTEVKADAAPVVATVQHVETVAVAAVAPVIAKAEAEAPVVFAKVETIEQRVVADAKSAFVDTETFLKHAAPPVVSAFDAVVAETEKDAPPVARFVGRTIGGIGKLGIWVGGIALLAVPGGSTVTAVWTFLKSPAFRLILALATTGAALGYAYYKGDEARGQKDRADAALAVADAMQVRAEKAEANALVVKVAADKASAANAASAAQVARLNARIAATKVTHACPPVLLDTIRGLRGTP